MPDSAADPRASLRRLVDGQRTLVLATADPEPWSAAVYYVRHGQRLCFFSSAKSRHVVAALAARRCAGTIFRETGDWRDIEGVQMDGRVEELPAGADASEAFAAYVGKFPTVTDLLEGEAPGYAAFTRRFRSALYAFVPERALYLSNRAGLGARREVQWPP